MATLNELGVFQKDHRSSSARIVLCGKKRLISFFPARADYLQVFPTHIFDVVTRATLVDYRAFPLKVQQTSLAAKLSVRMRHINGHQHRWPNHTRQREFGPDC
jgi:hypothetical protein